MNALMKFTSVTASQNVTTPRGTILVSVRMGSTQSGSIVLVMKTKLIYPHPINRPYACLRHGPNLTTNLRLCKIIFQRVRTFIRVTCEFLMSTALGVDLCNSATRLLVESDNINVFILQCKIPESEKRN